MLALVLGLLVIFAAGWTAVATRNPPRGAGHSGMRQARKGKALKSRADATSSALGTASSVATAVPAEPPAAELPAPLALLEPRASGSVVKGPADLPVPILMYHVVAVAPAHGRNPGLYVTPRDFIAQLRYLSDHGYRAVTIQQVYDFWHGAGSLPSHPVVLSFDDGYAPDFTVVAPLLHELRWPGVLNLIAGRGPAARMPTAQVRAMIACGWEVDSHTVSHVDLTSLGTARLTFELTRSKGKLAKLFGVPVNFFCYPSGRHDAKVVAAVREAGYLAATTTDFGDAHPAQMFTLGRIRVYGGESLAGFAASLDSAQHATKVVPQGD